jgi:DNA (cytosine-5)-methyltransferase 1
MLKLSESAKSDVRPIGIDLFSGAGGMSLGFEQAGFDVVAAVEKDPIHAAIHKFNFPRSAVLARDIARVTGEQLRAAAGIGDRTVDVVFGGAPCQGFSLIGHRVLDDPRNALVREFVRIVRELAPSAFVFENVKGLTVGEHRRFLDELVSAFVAAGYEVCQPWKVLNAAEYGVPQSRQRLFLMGVLRGERCPRYPTPSTRRVDKASSLIAPPGPSCADALGDLPDADQFAELMESDAVRLDGAEWGEPSTYARLARCLANDAWFNGHPRLWDAAVLTSSMRTEHTAISRRRFAETASGEIEPISRLFKLPADGVSNTLRAGTDAERGAFTSPRPIHYALPRLVTVREMARLHGFPDWFRFHATKWHGARQIGNAVPPPLARAVASSVMTALGAKPTRCSQAIELGNPSLLTMGMEEAAAHFGEAVVIGRRTTKSGARKRKQHEIEAARAVAVPHG